jgi:hypothetical protein
MKPWAEFVVMTAATVTAAAAVALVQQLISLQNGQTEIRGLLSVQVERNNTHGQTLRDLDSRLRIIEASRRTYSPPQLD